MSLRDRVPVEPLDDERLANIERAVITALPARAPRTVPWRFLVPVGLAAVAVAALAMWRSAPREAPRDPQAPLSVVADADGARVDLGDAVIVASPGARFEVTRPNGGIDVLLEIGKIELAVDKRGDRPPLLVHADDVEVMVVGTRFSVERGDEVSVIVTEGIVRVHRGDATVMVAAGEAWTDGTKLAVADTRPDPEIDVDVDVDPLDRDHEASAPPDADRGPEAGSGTGTGKRKPKGDKLAPIPSDPLDELRKAIAAQPIDAPEGDSASAQLYGKARDNAKTALRLLDQYVLQFPKGKELDDVLWLRLRIRCLKSLDSACRSAAYAYSEKVPGDSAKGQIAVRITITTTP